MKNCINQCNNYQDSILFQYDLAPGLSNQMTYTMLKNGVVKHVKYYLDSSANDPVHTQILYKTRLGQVASLINFPANGNQLIRGTNNSTELDLDCNILLVRGDMVILDMVSTSLLDVTIMAIINIEYEGGMY
jgi:hypothetical protein